ncbi:MAG: DNA polymerase III subunit delta [Bacteroidaceae bacterium]|nr:DNA polymerase III subunit delta [Bacteroidaceae bacterium]
MNFSDIIGQEQVKGHLMRLLTENKLPHAIMLCGPKGAGKLPLALAFAQTLLCQHPGPDGACGQCSDCHMSTLWTHPDLHFSFPICKAKSSDHPVSDDYLPQWREQISRAPYFDTEDWLEDIKAENQQITIYVQESDNLQRKLALKSSQGGRKVVVVWLPERMMEQTANKLLKLIEEPPVGTHFLLVSQEPDRVLGTIQSRVQRINVPPLPEDVISQALQVFHGLPAENANLLAHIAQGSYTEALKRMLSGSEQQLFFDLFVQLMRHSYARRIKEMHQWSMAVAELGRERQKRMLEYFQQQLRENFIYNFHQPELNYLGREEENFSTRFAPFINERNVVGIMNELSDAGRDIAQNVSARMVFFDLALKMIVLLKTP